MSSWVFPAVDEWGPEQVVYLSEPGIGLQAVVVVDNVAAGPAIGGVRMAPDVTPLEVFRLARAMTFKNAAAGLRHGGAKAGIVADPDMEPDLKVRLVRAFGAAMRHIHSYIPGPDMGLDEAMMAHLRDETGRAVGLPPVLGGIPLDVLGATGFGLASAAEVAREMGIVDLEGARVVVQGFGAVGRHAARFLAERGAILVAASDSRGAVADPAGLDIEKLIELKAEGRSVGDHPAGGIEPDELVGFDCDIWVPAARPDVFTSENASSVRAKLILQGANIPATREAEAVFHRRGVVSVPDFIANAGGVICAAVEYAGGTATQAFQTIDEKIRVNTREVLERSAAAGIEPREAAEKMATERVREAMGYRRSF